MEYDVAKEKGGKWYCHRVDSKIPITGTHGDKKKALHIAAELNGIPYKDFIKLRKKV